MLVYYNYAHTLRHFHEMKPSWLFYIFTSTKYKLQDNINISIRILKNLNL